MTIRFVPAHTESALEVVATERERTKAERDAFIRFADRVGAFETASHDSGLPHEPLPTRRVLQFPSGSDTTLARVRDAYRETVMSVPHYDEEYDESLRRHLSMEFVPEIATTLTNGSYTQFTSSLQAPQATLDTASTPRATKRLMIALAYADGVSVKTLSGRYDIPRTTIYSRLDRFEDGTVDEAVIDKPWHGRPSKHDGSQKERLTADLAESSAEHGYDSSSCPPKLVCSHIERLFGLRYLLGHAHRSLQRTASGGRISQSEFRSVPSHSTPHHPRSYRFRAKPQK